MASNKQITANRANARQSTGPVTDEGKATVAQNAISHGIFSSEIVVSSFKNVRDFEKLKHDLMASPKPTDAAQILLVEKIAMDQLGLP